MSNTRRRAKGDTGFNQERYASSELYGRALLGNLVAKRAGLIEDPEDRALVFWLQQRSHAEGGIERVAADLVREFPERIGTRTMVETGKGVAGPYSDEEAKRIIREIPGWSARQWSPESLDGWISQGLEGLSDRLRMLCLDPAIDFNRKGKPVGAPGGVRYCSLNECASFGSPEVWYFQDLVKSLHALRARQIAIAQAEIAATEVTEKIQEDMRYALESGSLVIIEGAERIGKSTAAESFCRRNPGKAVYVRLESGTDMATFYRSIARALGTACNAQRKAVEMRTRIEETLEAGHLMLVIDEAHHCFPQARRVHNAPPRIEWIRDMVDLGVPFVLLGTPQFDQRCRQHEEQVGWNARQIRGRVALHTILPTELSEADLARIARHMMPNGDETTIKRLVGVAFATVDYVAAIERVTKRSRYFAAKAERSEPNGEDVKAAVKEMLPRREEPEETAPPPAPERLSKSRLKEPLPCLQRQVQPLSLERAEDITISERRSAQTVS